LIINTKLTKRPRCRLKARATVTAPVARAVAPNVATTTTIIVIETTTEVAQDAAVVIVTIIVTRARVRMEDRLWARNPS